MITIKAGGKPLYIPKDTTLVLEQNNNVFNQDGFMEDIVWTFSIPAKPNMKTLGAVHYINYMSRRRYDCEVDVDGMPLFIGELYIQTTQDETTLNCGVVANSFGIGFGDRLLKDNNYGDDIVISDSEANHQTNWINFLRGSLDTNSIYKFFLFCCEKFYGENEDWGYHLGQKSGLMGTSKNSKMFFQYVNRLFWIEINDYISGIVIRAIVNNPDRNGSQLVPQGARVFNSANATKQNGYCYAPALRLDWLIGKVLGNANMKVGGSFLTNSLTKKIYAQSLCALDGDVFQYGVYTWLSVNGDINLYNNTITDCQQFRTDTDNNLHTSFGWINNVSIGFRLLLPVEELVRHDTNVSGMPGWSFGAQFYDEVYAILVGTADAEMPSMRMSLNTLEADGTHAFKYGRPMQIAELKSMAGVSSSDVFTIDAIYSVGNTTGNVEYTVNASIFSHKKTLPLIHTTYSTLVQLTASAGKNCFYRSTLGGYTEGNVLQKIYNDVASTTPQYLKLVKCRIATAKGSNIGTFWLPTVNKITLSDYGVMEKIYNYEIVTDQAIDTTDTPLNIFSNVMRWRDHVPNMTNGEFLTRICQIFGLNMFSSSLTKELQLSFFADTLKGGSFDISEWVTHIERMEYTPKQYKVNLKPALGTRAVSDKNIIDPVTSVGELPGSFINKNKHAFVRNENAYRRSTQQEGTSRFEWDQAGGNDTVLTAGNIGADKKEEVSIDANIPNMRLCDERISNTNSKYLCEIPLKGCSPLLDENFDGKFDLVLQQYHGKRLLAMGGGTVTSAYIESANPTCYNEDGTVREDTATFAADGENSIGRQWLKPLYDFLGNCESFRITAKLPVWAFHQVYKLLKPQDGEQTRWLHYNNSNFLPTKISYEFGTSSLVTATIECARRHYEID